MPAIHLQNISKQYEKGAAPAVDAVDLEIEQGEFMCLLGPSGCGKTTTLRMIAGLENISSGDIKLGDRVVDSQDKGVFVPPEKRNLGLVFQSYALWPHLSVEKNIDFGLKLRNIDKAEREEVITSVMRTLGIEKYRNRFPSQLSGGQQQRVALARMLAVKPDILLMDEPLSNLDARLRLEMRTELKRIHETYKTTIVFVTHDQWEAMALATKIAVMSEGELQQVGTPNDIYDRPANRFVAEFVGTPHINMIELNESTTSTVKFIDVIQQAKQVSAAEIATWAVGIRPERLQISPKDTTSAQGQIVMNASIESILPTGGSWIVELKNEQQTLRLTTQVPPVYAEGDEVALIVNISDMHMFNAQGLRVN